MLTMTALQDSDSFLGVTRSATGRIWVPRKDDERLTLALAQRFSLPDAVARAMSARGISLEQAADYLNPTLRALMPDPGTLKDMDKAAERFAQAVMQDEKAAVFGDYDVDGGTSAALLLRFVRAVGGALRLYVPDRMKEGYGPNESALRKLAEEGIRLVVCVDCGTTAHAPLTAAREAGLEVIVIDHHAAEPALPPCHALVNPNRLDEDKSLGHLAAVGVTFLFIVAVNRQLRAAGWFAATRKEPDLRQWLDLVALGTICDVVPLTGLNRAYVAQGLRVMALRGNAGIAALMHMARAKDVADAYTAGFLLGPRVNAGGRVGQSDLGARLLATEDESEAAGLALRLDEFNTERRRLEDETLASAEIALAGKNDAPLVLVAGEGWHPGVIGIVASRLKERYHRPAIVIALDGDIGKGSGRSVRGLDMGAMVIAARQAGLLINGGGHGMAAGLTVARDALPELEKFLQDRVAAHVETSPLTPSLTIDGMIAVAAATPDFVKQVMALAPFGTGNPEPRFVIAHARVVRADIVGERHVRCIVTNGTGARLTCIAFRAMDNGLGAALLNHNGQPLHLAGHLALDEWQGVERVQMKVEDVAGAGRS